MLFLIFQIQNGYDQKSCIQDNHKFFVCTHKPHSFLQDSETEWQRILPVAWVNILYCQCTACPIGHAVYKNSFSSNHLHHCKWLKINDIVINSNTYTILRSVTLYGFSQVFFCTIQKFSHFKHISATCFISSDQAG